MMDFILFLVIAVICVALGYSIYYPLKQDILSARARKEFEGKLLADPLCHVRYVSGHPEIASSEYYNLLV